MLPSATAALLVRNTARIGRAPLGYLFPAAGALFLICVYGVFENDLLWERVFSGIGALLWIYVLVRASITYRALSAIIRAASAAIPAPAPAPQDGVQLPTEDV